MAKQTSGWVKPAKESSHIVFTKWDEGNLLSVEFQGKKKFQYQNVTKDQFKEFQSAPSAGVWFNQNIRSNPTSYPFTEI